MRTIVLIGNFGATNIGDEALLESMLHLFRLHHKPSTTQLHVLSSNPTETEHRYAAKYQCTTSPLFPGGPRSLFTSLFPALRGMLIQRKFAEYIVFGGGGLFTDHSSLYAVFYWWMQFWAAKLLIQKPIHIVGQSFGPLERPLARALTRHVVRHATTISVRDEASKVLVQSLVERDVTVLPDLAFFYPLPDLPPQEKSDTLRIALSLRPWKDTYLWEEHILDTVRTLAEMRPVEIGLFPMQMVREEDVSLLEGFFRRLTDNEGISVSLHQMSSFGELATHLAHYDIAVGQRLHFLLCALRAHVPCIALSYSNKVSTIMEDAGMATLHAPESEALQAAIKDTLAEREERSTIARLFTRRMEEREQAMLSILQG